MPLSLNPLQDDLAFLARGTHLSEGKRDDSLRVICLSAAKALQISRVNVWLFDEKHTSITCVHSIQPDDQPDMKGETLDSKDYPLYFDSLERLRVVSVLNFSDDPIRQELEDSYLKKYGVETMLDAPVYSEGKVIGVVCHEQTHGSRPWTEDEMAFAGSIADFISIALETSRRIESEKENLAMQLKLLRAERLQTLGVVTGGIIHDFKNFLALIHSHAQLAQLAPDCPPEIHTRLENILKASADAAALCRELLRGTSSEKTIPLDFDMRLPVSEITGILGKSMVSGVHFSFQNAPSPLVIRAIPMKIKQIVMNLVMNAVESLIEDKGNVTVILKDGHHPDTHSPCAILTVVDDGSGMPDEIKKNLFEPFVTTKNMGSGLGMTSVAVYLKEFGAAAVVDSSTGKGTRIEVFFPLVST